MKNLIAIACALLSVLLWQPLLAEASGLGADGSELRFLNRSSPPEGLQFGAAGATEALAFTASAGESVQLNVGGSSYADACAVTARVLDPAGREIATIACAARDGQLAALSAARDGTYRVELTSTARNAGALAVSLQSSGGASAVSADACVQNTLALDTWVNGSWNTSCASVSYTGHYAQYYTITVPASEVITISLSSTTDAWLVLRSGSNTGAVVATDDNSGPGTDAMIARTLSAGTYTIEATTAQPSQTGSFSLIARTNTSPCYKTLKLNRTAYSSWSRDCESVSYADHYAKYYTLTVPSDEVVTITLHAATDSWLVLRSGNTQFGSVVATDDNSGLGTDAMIARTLSAGTYTIEATTAQPSQLGSFNLIARTDESPCYKNLKLDAVASSSWSSKCASVSYNDHYAKYYTITVPKDEAITITLTSATDTWLVLRSGNTQFGSVVATDDNSGPGSNAMIARVLSAGTYTIEATTAQPSLTGNFDLVARTNSAPCFAALPLDTVTSSQWSTDCESVSYADHYAKYYTLTVPADEVITLTLSSATDAWLVLRSGNTQFGSIVATDDNSGAGTDAQIARTLTAGSYTIEATTSQPSLLGSFTIVARTNSAPCFAAIAVGGSDTASWSTTCTSVSYVDHNALYYTLNVPSNQSVSITLTSATDDWLVLRSGSSQLGPVVATDDNSGGGTNAKIARTLSAGIYTIEATTNQANQAGSFTLSVGN